MRRSEVLTKREVPRCLPALAMVLLAIGCITVNLYFPVAEIREAAGEIVNEVRPEEVSEGGEAPAQPPPPADTPAEDGAPALPGEAREQGLFALFAPRVALAEEEKKESGGRIKLDISSPVISKVKETLKKRYPKLLPFYEKGSVGEGLDGYLALRDIDTLPLKEKRDVKALAEEENEDRRKLYTEIAVENKIDEDRIPDVAKLFGIEWQKKSKTGWWIEREKGKWEKKKPPQKKKADGGKKAG